MAGKGGYVHNTLILDRLERRFHANGCRAQREFPIKMDTTTCFIDLLVSVSPTRLLAVEAELSKKRVERDVDKAVAAQAESLWIVVPNPKVLRSVKKHLATLPPTPEYISVFVLTVTQALAMVKPLISACLKVE